jgi:phosphatidylinositol glycan class B
MLAEVKKLIQKDRKLQMILAGGFIIQLVTCITATGFYHPDQHFSIIEFSSWHLGKESGVSYVWEFTHFVRPSLQIYLFSGYYKLCTFLNIDDPYTQLTLLRIVLGLAMFTVFNLLALFYFKNKSPKVLYSVLLILNFSWMLPYTRTLFCSEIVSSLFFFGALYLYEVKKQRPGWWYPALTGFLLGLAFFFRFQMGFCIVGFGLWLLFIEKRYGHIFPMILGFLLATALNVYMDSRFYGEWIFIPYEYFSANITQGRASQFGTSSFLRYISLLIAVIAAPPFSLILFYYGCKAVIKRFREPIVLAVFLFIFFHCLVGHKEERFLFPVFNALPIVIGFALPDLFDYYSRCKKWIASLIRLALIITIILNTAVLILFAAIPYSQSVHFTSKLKKEFDRRPSTVYYLLRSPFETPGGSPLIFYKRSFNNLDLKKITYADSVRSLLGDNIYLAVTYNDLKQGRPMLDSLGYKPVLYSSKLLWNINEFLASKKINTINDIWVLYKKD